MCSGESALVRRATKRRRDSNSCDMIPDEEDPEVPASFDSARIVFLGTDASKTGGPWWLSAAAASYIEKSLRTVVLAYN